MVVVTALLLAKMGKRMRGSGWETSGGSGSFGSSSGLFLYSFLLAWSCTCPTKNGRKSFLRWRRGQWLTRRGHQEQGSLEIGLPSQIKYGCVQWGGSPKKEYGWQAHSSGGLRACEWEGGKEDILAGAVAPSWIQEMAEWRMGWPQVYDKLVETPCQLWISSLWILLHEKIAKT